MAQYIDKSALVTEIERLADIIRQGLLSDESRMGIEIFEERLISILDTLEVKEMDLEREYKEFVVDDPVYNKLVNGIVGKKIAEHFFELGISVSNKAQKGEKV